MLICLCLAVWVFIKEGSENMVLVVLLQIEAKSFTVPSGSPKVGWQPWQLTPPDSPLTDWQSWQSSKSLTADSSWQFSDRLLVGSSWQSDSWLLMAVWKLAPPDSPGRWLLLTVLWNSDSRLFLTVLWHSDIWLLLTVLQQSWLSAPQSSTLSPTCCPGAWVLCSWAPIQSLYGYGSGKSTHQSYICKTHDPH